MDDQYRTDSPGTIRVTETGGHGSAMWQIAHTATRGRRRDLLATLVRQHGWVVQSGPFAGMVLPDRASRDDGDLLARLLGCYEAELQEVIAAIAGATPDLIVNIGAAEGYYAIGMARLLPAAFVHAFDTEPKSQEICRLAAGLNDVSSRVSVTGQCTRDLLQAIVPRGRAPVVICDCDGYERELIDPQRVPALRTATMVVECHDYIDASITQTLVDRLSGTHTLEGIREGPRDPNAIPFLQRMDSLDRWLAICEYRPTMMHWLVAKPKP
jgi:Met-10+ like-protein